MKIKKVMAGMLAMVTVMGSLMSPLSAKADQIDAPYLALGADLNETEKSTSPYSLILFIRLSSVI